MSPTENDKKSNVGGKAIAAILTLFAGGLAGHFQNVVPKSDSPDDTPSYYRQRSIKMNDERFTKLEERFERLESRVDSRLDRFDDKLDSILRGISRSRDEKHRSNATVSIGDGIDFKHGG